MGFEVTHSITVCAFTTDETDAPLIRLLVEPNQRDGLRVTYAPSQPREGVSGRVAGIANLTNGRFAMIEGELGL